MKNPNQYQPPPQSFGDYIVCKQCSSTRIVGGCTADGDWFRCLACGNFIERKVNLASSAATPEARS